MTAQFVLNHHLILRSRGNLTFDGECGKKVLDLERTHLPRGSLVIAQIEASIPSDASQFGAQTVVLEP